MTPNKTIPSETPQSELHPLLPFLPENARLLMLGSFPPKKSRWSMDFFYPNLQNDMWRIFGSIFFGDKFHFLTPDRKRFEKDMIEKFLREKGVALSDTATEVIRLKDNASDKYLEVVATIDLEQMLSSLPACEAIVVTGQKAMDTILKLIETKEPAVGDFSQFTFAGRTMKLFRMPSSSRAYPKPLEEKADIYAQMFRMLKMIE